MTTILKAHFDGKVIVPDEPVQLPTGTPLTVAISSATDDEDRRKRREAGERFLALAEKHNLRVGPRTWTRQDLYDR